MIFMTHRAMANALLTCQGRLALLLLLRASAGCGERLGNERASNDTSAESFEEELSGGEYVAPGGPLPDFVRPESDFDAEYEVLEDKKNMAGKGGYGQVYFARKRVREPGSEVYDMVVKQQKYNFCADKKDKKDKDACKGAFDPLELKPMMLRLPFVVSYEDLFHNEEQHRVRLLMKRYAKDLEDYAKPKQHTLPLEQLKLIGAQVAYGVWQLHRSYIIWGDLKPRNVLVWDDKVPADQIKVALTDFGLIQENCVSGFCGDKSRGTLAYLAPSLVEKRVKSYGYEIDWWSFGVAMFYLAEGHEPFKISKEVVGKKAEKECLRFGPITFNRSSDPALHKYLKSALSCENYYKSWITPKERVADSYLSKKASDHPVLKDPFWHGETNADAIDAFWRKLCETHALSPEACAEPPLEKERSCNVTMTSVMRAM
eukprot:TRINITY_DN56302_c0_g1_i1.p1 TRINITY_DN56302_c0_g1~~TRINITY_DN56302_c0_g1_i1.p1  ORF type:complete len:429 (-),score=81.11 TRINITY_DN56302_c0_g1_i1:285-1571(-)